MLKAKPRNLEKSKARNGRHRANGASRRLRPWQRSLIKNLSQVDEVHAIFAAVRDTGECVVYTMIQEHHLAPYEAIMAAEKRVQRQFPEMLFDFKIWAHQGRDPQTVVPLRESPLYIR